MFEGTEQHTAPTRATESRGRATSIGDDPEQQGQRTCIRCLRAQDITEFRAEGRRGEGGRRPICRECMLVLREKMNAEIFGADEKQQQAWLAKVENGLRETFESRLHARGVGEYCVCGAHVMEHPWRFKRKASLAVRGGCARTGCAEYFKRGD